MDLLKININKQNNTICICFALLQDIMQVGTPHLYLLLLVGTFRFRDGTCALSLFSENATISAAYNVIESVLESVNLTHLIPGLLIKSDNPDQFLSTVIKF
jgi:hypothetical protein